MPFPFPHQTTMQPSETFCGRAPFSFSHSPAARPAEMISVADVTLCVWRREAIGAQRNPNTEGSTMNKRSSVHLFGLFFYSLLVKTQLFGITVPIERHSFDVGQLGTDICNISKACENL